MRIEGKELVAMAEKHCVTCTCGTPKPKRRSGLKRDYEARGLAEWLVAMDEPDSEDRRTVTLTKIIDRARAALKEPR